MTLKTLERVEEILKAYFETSLPDETEEKILAWIAVEGHGEEKDVVLEKMWNSMVSESKSVTSGDVFSLNTVRAKLGMAPAKTGVAQTRREQNIPQASRRRANGWMLAAVAIPFALLIGFFAARIVPSVIERHRYELTEATAKGGTHEHLVLADGTEIWLRSGSSIKYSRKRDGERTAYLKGEAYFNVAKSENPFIVNTSHMTVEVAGTEFDVSSFEGDDFASVKLNSGTVHVNVGEHRFTMTPGDKVEYAISSNSIYIDSGNDTEKPQWIEGILAFENMTLEEILRTTERHFGVRIEKIGDIAQSDKRYTATFDSEAGIDYVLGVFSVLTERFAYTVEEDVVRVVFK